MTASPSYKNDQTQVEKIRGLKSIDGLKDKAKLHLVGSQGQIQVHMTSYRGTFPVVLSEALRAAGLGSEVLIAQFLKGGVRQGPNEGVELCGRLKWIRPNLSFCVRQKELPINQESIEFLKAKQAIIEIWKVCKDRLLKNNMQKIVLDEIGLAIQLGFLEEEELISALEERLGSVDVILTGPSIPPKVIAMADQVTELRCTK